MPLLIALFLIVVISVKCLGDKANSASYNAEYNMRKDQCEMWHDAHVDQRLEEDLRAFVSNPANYERVWEEVSAAFKEMEHWRGIEKLLLNEEQSASWEGSHKSLNEQLRTDRKIAIDIMLANRGKVSHDSTRWGYKSFLKSNYIELKRKWFEYAEWIANTLNKQGISVSLLYKDGLSSEQYVWAGSYAGTRVGTETNTTYRKFDRALITRKNVEISTPYFRE